MHYAWLLLSILLVVGELTKDSQFPTIGGDLLEAARYTATKDVKRICEMKVF